MEYSYTGVGARKAPVEILALIRELSRELAVRDFCLRSGGADGSDTAFEDGCKLANGLSEIFIPWKNFNGRHYGISDIHSKAFDIASEVHPAWDRLRPGGKKLHARNVHQVLGKNLDDPSLFTMCWTPDGKDVGGTRTAIVVSRMFGVPVINLGLPKYQEKTANFVLDELFA